MDKKYLLIILGIIFITGAILLFWRNKSQRTDFVSQNSPAVTAENKVYSYSSINDGVSFGGEWKNEDNSILQADSSGRTPFPLFVFSSPVFSDLTYTAEFRIRSGEEDQYAGFVYHLLDEKNYYVVRYSASENSIFFARFDNGERTILKSFNANVKINEWQTIKILVQADTTTIFLNDTEIGKASDTKWLTGKVGLGTKADSITEFRNIKIQPLPLENSKTGSTKTTREVALMCTLDMYTQYHIHPHLDIIIDGQKQIIPANVGITPGCLHPVHTHDDTGIIHVESPEKRDFTLADFFAVWDKPFNKDQILDYSVDNSHIIKEKVDGKEVRGYENTPLYDNEQIIISYEKK